MTQLIKKTRHGVVIGTYRRKALVAVFVFGAGYVLYSFIFKRKAFKIAKALVTEY
jgi:hypothetical protein